MELTDLYRLAKWYEKNILANNLVGQLNVSVDIINKLLSNQVTDPIQRNGNYNKILEVTSRALEKINYSELDFNDIALLENMGLKNIILEPASKSIKNLLSDKPDIHNVSARFVDKHNTLKSANDKFNQILTILPTMIEVKDSIEIKSNKVLTRIRFQNEASINNVVNLSDWSNRLNKIARGYSMVLGNPPEEFEIISASKGSIVFDLLLDIETINMFADTFNQITSFAVNCAELKAALEAIKFFKDKNPDEYNVLKDAAENESKNAQDAIAEKIAESLHKKYAVDKENKETQQILKSGIKELNNFIDKGGDIAFKSNDLSKNEEISLVNNALKHLKNRNEDKRIEKK